MDCRPVVDSSRSIEDPVRDDEPTARAGQCAKPRIALIDRAIFASVPSPLARGYRIVAASPGLSEDEKREIVQRAPSHGNLSDASPQARGVAGLPLQSGRYALLLCKHAGREPSGRGGFCVWTDVLLLAADAFERFGCDPFRVECSARPFLDAPPNGQSGGRPGAISITIPREGMTAPADPAGPTAKDLPGLKRVIASGLTLDRVVVVGAPDARQVMQWVLAALPLSRRRMLSFAYGLRFSSQRAFRILFTSSISAETESFARDHTYTIVDWHSVTAPPATPLTTWLDFVVGAMQGGRMRFLCALTEELSDEPTPARLAGLAELATIADNCDALETRALEAAQARWRTAPPAGPTQRELMERLLRALADRAASLAATPDSGHCNCG